MLFKEAYSLGASAALSSFSLDKLAAPMPMGRLAPHIAPATKGQYKGLAPVDRGGAAVTQRGELRKAVTFKPAPVGAAPGAAPGPGMWDTAKSLGNRAIQGYEGFAAQNPHTASALTQVGATGAMMGLPMLLSSRNDDRR